MVVAMAVVVVVVVMVAQGNRDAIGLTGAGALVLTEGAALDQALHMVVVALLRGAHLCLKPEHLGAVLAEGAIHQSLAPNHLLHPLAERGDHEGVITQIGGVHELHLGMVGCHQGRVLANPTYQHPGKEEIGKHHNPLEAQPHHMAQARFHQGEGHPGIHGLAPAKAEAFHQHARHLRHVGVGIRIGGAPPHHHQQGVAKGDSPAAASRRGVQGLLDAGPSGLDHLQIHAELTAVINA